MNDNRCVMTHRVDPDRPRQAVDGLYLCAGHLGELEQLIAEMPAYCHGLQRAKGAGGQRPPGAHSELSVDDAIADHRSKMSAVLASWCRVVAEDRGMAPPDSPEIHHVAAWLLAPKTRNVEWCAANPWVDEMLTELRQVTGAARALTDLRARRVPFAAPCLQQRDGARCEGTVTIIVRGDDWHARCSSEECDQRQEVAQYMRTARKGQWVTEQDVITLAARYGIAASSDVVRQWKHRRKIVGISRADGNAYDLASVTGYLARRKAQRERIAS